MQADEMYPEKCRRNYKSFIDGLIKVSEEGALFRGALANGLKIAGLVSAASGSYDWVKENTFYFFGPITAVRLLATTAGVATAVALSMPFDAIRTRLHTMRPLPNGQMPYEGTLDCF
jgi:solute carrier family 25 oxoglutarate transporter 11